ncbi:hypothetical protein KAR91_88170 [Candidatus Pacearchaeota archaeon]|nr:hypothetical protein [Candidatus Pacearchaeota archaeon]
MALGGWSGEKIEFRIPSAGVEGDLTDFPVNVLLSTSAGIGDTDLTAFFTEIGSDANRKKIAVALADDTTECYIDIERWDNANKKASLHVKVPFLSSSADTILYLYADSAHADNTTYVGDSGDAVAENVWDSDYEAVYHFAQDPQGGGAQLIDSTSNSNDGTSQGTMLTEDLVDAGVDSVQKAWDLDGDDDHVDLGVPLVIGSGQDFTIEIFADNADKYLWSTARGTGAPGSPILRGHVSSTQAILFGEDNNGDPYQAVSGSSSVDPQLNTFIRDGSTFKAARADLNPATAGVSTLSFDDSENTYLGKYHATAEFQGPMIEARISSVARSTAWYKATHRTLYDNFVGYGAGVIGSVIATLPTLVGPEVDRVGNLTVDLPLLESTGASGWTGIAELPVLTGYSEAYIDHIESANLTLPSLTIEMISGASAILELGLPEITATGLHAYPFNGDMILPSLTVNAIPGMIGDGDLGSIAFTGSGLQGVVGGVNDFLPKLICSAYLNVVQHGTIDVRMKRLLLEAAATVGGAYNMALIYPRLTVQIEAVFGTIGSIDTNLPAIEESGMNSYNDIRGNMTGELNI